MSTEKAPENWDQWLYGIIRFICDKKHKYINHSEDIEIKWSENPYSCSLLMRSFYGGMGGDMRLLKHCAKNS